MFVLISAPYPPATIFEVTREILQFIEVNVPELVMLPSGKEFCGALSYKDDDRFYVLATSQPIGSDAMSDCFYYDGSELTLADLATISDSEMIATDLWPLRVMYSIIGTSLTEEFNKGELTKRGILDYSVNVRLVDLQKALCTKGNISKERATGMVNKLLHYYEHFWGVIYPPDSDIECWERK